MNNVNLNVSQSRGYEGVDEITNVFDDLSEEYEGLLMEKLERCR